MKAFATGILAAGVLLTIEPAAPAAAQTGEVEKLTAAQNEIYGNYVADAGGRALYMFTPDTQGKGEAAAASACYDACARAWPPALAEDLPEAGAKLDRDLLGTARRKDGAVQLTYGGWPLYYYVGDRGPGSVAGQDIHSFGGAWYLLAPDGSVIEREE